MLNSTVAISLWAVAPTAIGADAADSAKGTASPPKEYYNWVDLSVGGYFVNGDAAALQRRLGVRRGAFGGIKSFHLEQELSKKTTLKIDGRGLFDLHDYSLKVAVENPDVGYVRAGYREFRTWYDGSGGFYPSGPNGWWSFRDLGLRQDEDLTLDRGEVFFEAGLTRPNVPELHFKYTHQFRDGNKDSTIWGDSTQGASGLKAIVPTFLAIDEARDIFEGDIKHRLGKTDLGLGLRYEILTDDNRRFVRRQPGESVDRSVTDRERVETDLFNVHAFTETRFSEKVRFSTGYSFTSLDSDLFGYRRYGSRYDPDFAQRLPSRLNSFDDLAGGSQVKQYVLHLNLLLNPWQHFSIVPAVRVERQDLASASSFLLPAPTGTSTPPGFEAESERGLLDVAESLEARYTGLTNWVFYVGGYWLVGRGDLEETLDNRVTRARTVSRSSDDERVAQKYTVGTYWYPLRRLHLAAQYYHKIRSNDYEHQAAAIRGIDAGFGLYPAFLTAHDFETDDLNFRVTWRPLNNLTFVSRYDFRLSTVDTQGSGLPQSQSAEMTSHVLSESVTWSPWAWLYVQGSINYVLDQTDTPAVNITNLVQTSRNDYWNASLASGVALNDKTDLQAQYLFYRANNYSSRFVASLPYGAGAEEHGLTVGLSRQIRDNMRWSCKYGYFKNRDETSGFHNNYEAHLVYSSLQYLW
ncbi:MAG: hypothetical protein HYY24_26800 [Verrucomicrobia bacterium]|nr:hypothetical protein [Verrucomicrobiota bacterium]